MLLQIGNAKPARNAELDAIDRLLDCHVRIRNFCALGHELARAAGKPDAQIVDAAQQLIRYFEIAFPLHVADEDLSLVPRLREHARSGDLAAALSALTVEHREQEPMLAELLQMWKSLAEAPNGLAAIATDLGFRTAELSTLLEEHLQLEEQVLMPWARTVLDTAAMTAMRDEMVARRAR